jgi:hypothetical protein
MAWPKLRALAWEDDRNVRTHFHTAGATVNAVARNVWHRFARLTGTAAGD